MVEVLSIRRKSAVLTPSSLACLSRVPTVNVAIGCAHGCLYCYTRGYRGYPGEGVVGLYVNTPELLRQELRHMRHKPVSVYFSPATDLFQPVTEVLELAYEVLREVLARGIAVAFLTKGAIPEQHFALLAGHAALVHAQVGLITLDDAVLRVFEPAAAPAGVRLSQMKRLAESGIRTQMRVDPILPGVTDDVHTFDGLCQAAAEGGVSDLAASVLFLRPAVLLRLRQASVSSAAVGRCLDAFRSAQRMPIRAEHSTVTALPREERERILERLENAAADHGVSVRRCACKNPDLARGTCSIADGLWHTGSAQGKLFA